jgi:hypothetical protein
MGGGSGRSISYGGDTTYSETYAIHGPITINNPANVQDFMNQLKSRARVTGSR